MVKLQLIGVAFHPAVRRLIRIANRAPSQWIGLPDSLDLVYRLIRIANPVPWQWIGLPGSLGLVYQLIRIANPVRSRLIGALVKPRLVCRASSVSLK